MNKKTKINLQHLAKLANISILANEEAKFQKQLEEILEFVNQLNELNTENIKSTAGVIKKENVFFKDGQSSSGNCDLKHLKIQDLAGRKYFVIQKVKWE